MAPAGDKTREEVATVTVPETLIVGDDSFTAAIRERAPSERPPPSPPKVSAPLPARYEYVDCIATGSFGEVWRVRDHVLDRVLAMKLLRAELVATMRTRFLVEARITADLQHPGIVAIHDQGELGDGRLWFTMKEVRGRTLREVIDEVHAATGPDGFHEAKSGWTFRRLVDAFARVSQAVAYAHDRGVMHRDLKPDNLMVGEFGEVLVMDWGLARRVDALLDDSIDDDDNPASGAPAVVPGDAHPGLESSFMPLTQYGDIIGTPAYMSPEQAFGYRQLHCRASDVYSLGAILYHLLCGRPPYVGYAIQVVRQVRAGPPPPLAEVLRGRPPVPEELVVLCERAMQRRIEDRYVTAAPLAREVLAFLEGARLREQALAMLADARALEPRIAELRSLAERRREEAQAALTSVQPFDPIEKKRPGWALEDEAAALRRDAALHETEWLQTVHGALSIRPELPEAHALLADHYREQLLAAERAQRDEAAARSEALLRSHDRGQHAAFLRGDGAVSLVTDPPGAVVQVERYELRDRRLVPVDAGTLGVTPLAAAPLQHGSYRLRIRAPGRREVLYPVLIERGAHWDGIAPGDREPLPIALPPEGELGADDCYVPAGWSWIGGDPEAGGSLGGQQIWVDGFVIRRFPVTNRDFLEFLNALVDAGREAEAVAACPKAFLGSGEGELLAMRRDGDGRFLLMADTDGRLEQPDWPVLLVDWHGATAYARWLAERSGLGWRLPNEVEREKAARGADGRFCPWGNHLDATFACAAESHAGKIARVGVEAFPLDESPYGVRGLAGSSRDWCVNAWRREGPRLERRRLVLDPAAPGDPDFRAVRGGAWTSPLEASRSAWRFASRPDVRRFTVGMRVARGPLRGLSG